ncbi:SURF1 family protein, partial [Pseudemcibacter sp.]|uniref:SURF1 family protein n=1 Tax=Pseudemcibacter sp. TaxID=2943293 RepID=UPI003F696BA3
MTIPLLVCLLLLGNWQVERLDWKLDLIEKIKQRATSVPVSLPTNVDNLDDLEYLHVTVNGIFDHDHEMTMYSVGPNGEPGYDLYTPLILNNGTSVIVNRGWVPEPIKNQSDRPDTLDPGNMTVEGLLRKPWKKLWYGPENDPENNMWFYGDVDGMAEYN